MNSRLLPAIVGVVLVAASAAVPSSVATAAPTASAPTASTGEVVDVKPTKSTLNAAQRHTNLFVASFQAEAGETRFVGTELVVLDAKGTSPNEIFLGVTLSCKGPSGTVTSAEAGRNVWPAASSFTIPVSFTFVTAEDGKYNCSTNVMMCDPGNCTSPTGTGTVRIVTQAMDPKSFSFLYISTALPSWAQSDRVPASGDKLVKPGGSLSITDTFDASNAAGPVRIGAILSITNCIEKSFPNACKRAGATNPQGSSTVKLTLTLTQEVTTPGAECNTASASTATGARSSKITWQQHHAVFSIWVPDFELSTADGCGQGVDVALTVSAGKGNAVVVEAGSKAKATSILYVIPGDTIPTSI
jgi:hypothetical protein